MMTEAHSELYVEFNRKLIELLIELAALPTVGSKNMQKAKNLEKRITVYQENMAKLLRSQV